jgi:hypothetical protein
MKLRFFATCLLVLGGLYSCCAQLAKPTYMPQIEPRADVTYTSTREVRSLCLDGTDLWAATAGGVLRGGSGGSWTKWTRRTGLPFNEAFEVAVVDKKITVRFPLHSAVYDGKKWTSNPAPAYQKKSATVFWNGQKVVASLDGLQIGTRKVPNPPSVGTHISAIFADGKDILVAMYGDGIWLFDGKTWKAYGLNDRMLAEAKEITALVKDKSGIVVGTRRAGIWRSTGEEWRPVGSSMAQEIVNPNVQWLTEYQGVLWASTLDDGLMVRSGETWQQERTPTLSSSAPRQLLVWKDRLYVRHGGGAVDSFDGRNWVQNALKTMPRKGVYALAGNEKTLFAAGWGGWSEWDGSRWTPHFEVTELKGIPLMGLLTDGDVLWIATQSRGLGRYDRVKEEFRWFDERDGLPDDWVTALVKFEGRIYAGTFVGGLARLEGEKWVTYPELKGENVTSMAVMGKVLFVATRSGVWEIEGDKVKKLKVEWLDSEVQALWPGEKGLWVGTRTSLNFLKLGST